MFLFFSFLVFQQFFVFPDSFKKMDGSVKSHPLNNDSKWNINASFLNEASQKPCWVLSLALWIILCAVYYNGYCRYFRSADQTHK